MDPGYSATSTPTGWHKEACLPQGCHWTQSLFLISPKVVEIVDPCRGRLLEMSIKTPWQFILYCFVENLSSMRDVCTTVEKWRKFTYSMDPWALKKCLFNKLRKRKERKIPETFNSSSLLWKNNEFPVKSVQQAPGAFLHFSHFSSW